MHKFYLAFFLLLCSFIGHAQEYFPTNGVDDPSTTSYLFEGATIQVSPEQQLTNSDIRIQNGKIIAVGELSPLQGEVVIDVTGKYIYPGFIDLDSDYGLQKSTKKNKSHIPQYETSVKGPYGWNEAVKPEVDAVQHLTIDMSKVEAYHTMGFTSVLTHHHDGIVRGTGAFVHLRKSELNKSVDRSKASAHFSFSKGSSQQQYPSSLMGVIALLRQTHYDAEWYNSISEKDHTNLSLEAWNQSKGLPWFLEVKDALDIPRAMLLSEELNQPLIIRGGNDTYQVIDQIGAQQLIIPLTVPKALDVEDPLDAMQATTAQLKHWDLSSSNAAILTQRSVPISITSNGITTSSEFFQQLQLAVKHGMSQEEALKALTTVPASWIGKTDIGELTVGFQSNFFITSQSIFEPDVEVLAVNVQDEFVQYQDFTSLNLSGSFNLNIEGTVYPLKLKSKGKKLEGYVLIEGDTFSVKGSFTNEEVNFYHSLPKNVLHRYSGKPNFKGKILDGRLQTSSGDWKVWSAVRQGDADKNSQSKDELEFVQPERPWFPNVAFGYDVRPERKDYFIDQVTIWTCDSNGKYLGDVVVRDGKIAEVGKNLAQTPDLEYINGKGMHLTPGIVDEHSHIAISRGVNEGTQASSAEVRIGDVVNPVDINIYRQLSGGVTTAQLLHGSANPIGGQSAIIKLKWGTSAETMKIGDAPGFIKFALGENVKQSNWGDYQKSRFPQTRMGVEQVYYDHFNRAKKYNEVANPAKEKGLLSFFQKDEAPTFRRDLELEALAEILDSTRFISCHSYVQSEINMLMHVADSMGFKVNTFTHILEGYKLADKLAEHGAAGSTFADWWAYKFEVNDAIPYNAAILHEQGVLTGINSDDAEMGRRLNQEAAKTVKYGSVSEEEALKMVTINPATMLHLEERIGSVTQGKDADLVLWTGHPLSVYSKVLFTMIEGVIYFSQDQHEETIVRMNQERDRIIQKMIKAKHNGAETEKVQVKNPKLYHCDTDEDEGH